MIIEVHPHIVGNEAIAAMDAALKAKGFSAVKKLHKTVLYLRDDA